MRKALFATLSVSFSLVVLTTPISLFAQAQSKKFDGTAVKAAGAINPPDPLEQCNLAKQDAKTKAVGAGFTGKVEWDKLSTDSDCSLHNEGSPTTAYLYIFTATGTFYK